MRRILHKSVIWVSTASSAVAVVGLMPAANFRFLKLAETDENGLARHAGSFTATRCVSSQLPFTPGESVFLRWLGGTKAAHQARTRITPGDPDLDLFAAARGRSDRSVARRDSARMQLPHNRTRFI